MPFAIAVAAVVVGNVVTEMIGNGLQKLHPVLERWRVKLNVAARQPKAPE